jgi:predicted SAM-dependent methyltransferase
MMKFLKVVVVHHTYTQRRKNTGPDAGETWYMRVVAVNGENLLTSETYTTRRAVMNLARPIHFALKLYDTFLGHGTFNKKIVYVEDNEQ